MLLWVLILTGFGAAVAGFGKNLPPALQARVLSVQAMITLGFLAFLIFTSNPFERMFPAPLDGRDLNPAAAGSGARIPSAHALRRLRGFLHRLFLRGRRSDRGQGGRRLGAVGPPLDPWQPGSR